MVASYKSPTSELVEDNINLVKAVVSRFLKKSHIEDSELYSVGCVGLMHAAQTYDPSKSKFSTWATRIITQRIINEIRRHKRAKRHNGSLVISELDEQEKDVCLEDISCAELPIHLIETLINETPSETQGESENRVILVRHFLEDHSFSEIGRELGITREAVRKRAQKAIESIRCQNVDLLREYIN